PDRESAALTSHRAVARLGEELTVEVEGGDGSVQVGVPVKGAKSSAPVPGSVMRAAVAACLVVGYKRWSEKLSIPIDDVEVELTTEIDLNGQWTISEVPPGWQRIRWHVRVTSSASDADVERLLTHADRLSPMLDCLNPRCERLRTFEVKR